MLEDLDLGPRTFSREVWTACMGVDCMDHGQLHSPPTVSHQPTKEMVNSRSANNSPWLETEFKSDDDYLTFMDSLGMDVRKDTERRSLNSLQE